MTTPLIWLHEDALSATHPAAQGVELSRLGCFVWDEAHLRQMGYGHHRLIFIYETLCALEVPIYRGDTVETLTHLAAKLGADHVRTPWTPNPDLQRTMEALEGVLPVERIFEVPLVELPKPPKLRRFFAYWKSARKVLMAPPRLPGL